MKTTTVKGIQVTWDPQGPATDLSDACYEAVASQKPRLDEGDQQSLADQVCETIIARGGLQ